MWRHIASNFLTFLVVVVFLIGGVILWGQSQYTTAGPLEQSMCLRVERGTNMSRVSEELVERGAVSNGALFRIGADYSDKAGLLKAGSWLIPEQASMSEVTDIITKGGASTCGTQVVYRIGVPQVRAEVRELDPATEEFVDVVDFTISSEASRPAEYTDVIDRSDTRYRIDVAEGVTSWQIVTALYSFEVLIDQIATVGVLRTHRAVVGSLGLRITTGGEARRTVGRRIPQEVLLLETEPEIIVIIAFVDRRATVGFVR